MDWPRAVMVLEMTNRWGRAAQAKKDTAAVGSLQPHTADSCESEPGSNRASLPLTANPLPPAGEHIGEEQKKEVKRPYAACMRAESSGCQQKLRNSKSEKCYKETTGTKACAHLV